MYITRHGDYKYLEEKTFNGKVKFKISVNVVSKIIDAYLSLTDEQKRTFINLASKNPYILDKKNDNFMEEFK